MSEIRTIKMRVLLYLPINGQFIGYVSNGLLSFNRIKRHPLSQGHVMWKYKFHMYAKRAALQYLAELR